MSQADHWRQEKTSREIPVPRGRALPLRPRVPRPARLWLKHGAISMNVRKLLAVAAASSALAAAPTVAQERGQVPPFRAFDCPPAAVENLDAWVARYSTAWASQDAMTVTALHAPDTEWI